MTMQGSNANRSTSPPASPEGVARIALRGRRLDRPASNRRRGAKHAPPADGTCVVPAFVAGPENRLVGRVMGALVGHRPNRAGLDLAGPNGGGLSGAGFNGLADQDDPFSEPNRPHGPITLVGPSGCGKTHLAHGLAERWHTTFGAPANNTANNNQAVTNPGARNPITSRGVAYLTASDFSRQLADAIEDGAVNDLRRQLRGCGLLVIDDVDRISAAAYVQEELLHTIDALIESGAVVVLAAAKLPADTPALGRPLVSRLAEGLVLEIAPLGVEARTELLRDVAATLGCRLDGAALATLAGRLPGEPAQVLGAGVELRRRFGARIDSMAIEKFLADNSAGGSPPLRDILAAAARYYGVTQKMLTSASRRQTVVLARAVTIYLARNLTPLSYQEIGRSLGGRDHTTVLHNFRRIETALPKDRALRSAIEDLRRTVERQTP